MNSRILITLAFLALAAPALSATPAAYLTTPTTCDTVVKIENGTVYLASPRDCATKPGRVRVDVPADLKEIEVIVNGASTGRQPLQRYDAQGVQGVLSDAEKLAESLKVVRAPDPDSREAQAAKKSAELFYSPEYQARITAESERLKQTVFAPVMKEYYPEEATKQQTTAGRLAADERIYVFISSSIPDDTLRAYVTMADKAKEPNMVFVLRGLIGGAKQVGPTMTFVTDLLKKDPGCDIKADKCETYQANVQVDPLLFARYHVTQVPAVVYARNVQTVEGFGKSEGLTDEVPVGDAFLVEGDASLDRLLEVINREAKSKTVEGLVTAMRKGFY